MGLFSRRKVQESQAVEVQEGWPVEASNGFVVLDIETTGLSPVSDRILEIGMVRVDSSGNPLGYWSSLVNPQGPVGATHIHGIKDSDVSNSPTFEEIISDLLPKIQGQVLVAHNASFDHSFLRTELGRQGWVLPEIPIVCTMVESKYFLPGLDRRRLSDCAQALGINQEVLHRALGDASLTTSILHFYLNGPVNRNRSSQIQLLTTKASKVKWPIEPGERISPKQARRIPSKSKSAIPVDLFASVTSVMPEDLLGDSASVAELSYANLLLTSLEDGELADVELAALADCAENIGLQGDVVSNIHVGLLMALAREAWRDGVVSRSEKQQITECASRLGLDEASAKKCLQEVEELRAARVAARAKQIPTDWQYGEPLRVGDRVVITGCYELGREELERTARNSGLKLTGSVSGKTTLLVSDGTVGGGKDNDAQRLGIRVVRPEEFRILLEFIQPQTSLSSIPEMSERGGTVELENLVCVTCGQVFSRQASPENKRHECESCRK